MDKGKLNEIVKKSKAYNELSILKDLSVDNDYDSITVSFGDASITLEDYDNVLYFLKALDKRVDECGEELLKLAK